MYVVFFSSLNILIISKKIATNKHALSYRERVFMLSAFAGFRTELTTLPSASPREILGGQNNIVIIVIVGKYM